MLPARLAVARVHRKYPDLLQLARLEPHAVHAALPVARRHALSAGGTAHARTFIAGTLVVEIGRRGAPAQARVFVLILGLEQHGIVLQDEVADAVEDGPALVNLDAAVLVRAGARDHVRARVDHGVVHDPGVLGRLVSRYVLVVHGDDHPLRHAPRVADALERALQVGRVRIGMFFVLLAQPEPGVVVETIGQSAHMDLGFRVRWYVSRTVWLVRWTALRQTQRLAELFDGRESFRVHRVLGVVPQEIGSRAPLHVPPLVPGATP